MITSGVDMAVRPVPDARRNQLGTAGMVCGIVGVLVSWLGFTLLLAIVPLALGVLGIVFGVIGGNRVTSGEATNRGMAGVGVATGAIAVGLTVVCAAVPIWFMVTMGDVQNCIDSGFSESLCNGTYGIF
jgi:hypothetical protein